MLFNADCIHPYFLWTDEWRGEARCLVVPVLVVAPAVCGKSSMLHALHAGALGFHLLDLKLHFDTV